MSLDKAIEHNKEHRKKYYGAKSIDRTCRNHGTCPYCQENIIKEVKEYIMTNLITEWDIKNDGYVSGSDLPVDAITPILKILDKEVN